MKIPRSFFLCLRNSAGEEQPAIHVEPRLPLATGRFLHLSGNPSTFRWRAGAASFFRGQTSILEIPWNFWATAIVFR